VGKLPFLVILLLAVVLNMQMADPGVKAFVPLSQRLLCVPWLVWHWVIHLLGIAGPVPFHPWPAVGAGPGFAIPGMLALLACVALLVIAWRRRWHAVWQALLAFAFLFAPAVLIVLEGKRPFATGDRYGYLPMVALVALLAGALPLLKARMRQVGVALLVLGLGACVFASHRAAATWKDSITLWSRVLEVYPGTYEALLSRGSAYAYGGQPEKARRDYAAALERWPQDRQFLDHLVRLDLEAERYGQAYAYLERYLAVGPPDLETYLALGYTAAKLGRHADALRWYGFAERTAPSDPRVHEGRSQAFLEASRRRLGTDAPALDVLAHSAEQADRAGHPEAALLLLHRAAKVPSPHRAHFLFHIGRILLSRGAREEGRSYLRKALDEDPAHVQARQLLER
jgi:tetratricopeptide (TPR) repeat protein